MDLRRDRGVLQNAVDAIAYRELVLVWLDMDITRAFVYSFEYDFVHQLDDTGLLRHLQQVLARIAGRRDLSVITDHFIERVAAQPVLSFDDLLNVITQRQYRLHIES